MQDLRHPYNHRRHQHHVLETVHQPTYFLFFIDFFENMNNLLITNSIKGKLPYKLPWRDRGGVIYSSTFTFTLDARWGLWITPPLDSFTPGSDAISIVYEAGWASGSVWTRAKNLAPNGIRFPDRPTLSQLLHRLRYPGPRFGGN
jgi:hypothetical protein